MNKCINDVSVTENCSSADIKMWASVGCTKEWKHKCDAVRALWGLSLTLHTHFTHTHTQPGFTQILSCLPKFATLSFVLTFLFKPRQSGKHCQFQWPYCSLCVAALGGRNQNFTFVFQRLSICCRRDTYLALKGLSRLVKVQGLFSPIQQCKATLLRLLVLFCTKSSAAFIWSHGNLLLTARWKVTHYAKTKCREAVYCQYTLCVMRLVLFIVLSGTYLRVYIKKMNTT